MILSDEKKAKMTEYGIPGYMQAGIVRYYEAGIKPGQFLCAVINNDLSKAIDYADDTNAKALKAYVVWFFNQVPIGSWGHASAVKDWVDGFKQQEESA